MQQKNISDQARISDIQSAGKKQEEQLKEHPSKGSYPSCWNKEHSPEE